MAWAACLALGCSKPAPTEAPVPAGLRVELPDGWVAAPFEAGLGVGPKGSVVVTLETSTEELPAGAALRTALEHAGATSITLSNATDFVGGRYTVGTDAGRASAFIGLKRIGPGTVRCASTVRADDGDLAAIEALCRTVSRTSGR